MFFTSTEALQFNYMDYTCSYDETQLEVPTWLTWFAGIFSLGGFLLAIVILVITSAILLMKARILALERGRNLRWQGVLTVTATTVVYLVSILPYFIVAVSSLAVTYSITTWRIVLYISNLNIMANFYIYSLTVRSFREFLCFSLRQVATKLGMLPPTAAVRSQGMSTPSRGSAARSSERRAQNQYIEATVEILRSIWLSHSKHMTRKTV
jgi:hypothetical protein